MKISLIQIRDYLFNGDAQTHDYKVNQGQHPTNHLIGGISLLPNKTARTNVMIRGKDGKFLSYRDPEICADVRTAMNNLKPFPTVE